MNILFAHQNFPGQFKHLTMVDKGAASVLTIKADAGAGGVLLFLTDRMKQ